MPHTTTIGALAGRRVLEIADEKGVYCGKLLADMGADVIKVEPPGGDSTREIPPFLRDTPHADGSLFFLYMNTSKRGITLDLAGARGRELFLRLARGSDLVIETLPPGHLDELGLGYEALREGNPAIVLTSITGFGRDGPHSAYASADIVANALGGAMQVTGYAEDPPVVLAGMQAWISTSTCAAVASLTALHHAGRSGAGQHVDISAEEVVASVTHICGVGKWLDDGIVPVRFGTALFASVPSGAYRCKDGFIYLMVNRPAHWKALAAWVNEVTGNQEVLDPMFEGPSAVRQPYRELLDIFITELTERFTVEHVYREGQRRHLAFTPVSRALDVIGDAHLAARDFFVTTQLPHTGALRYPGAPYRHGSTPWRISRPAPRVGEHDAEILEENLGFPSRGAEATSIGSRVTATDRRAHLHAASDRTASSTGGVTAGCGALGDLRVLELTAGMAGPWIGRFMAYCGAEVIKVESRAYPDVTRLYVHPRAPELGPQEQISPWFTDWNAGKRFVSLNLTNSKAVELCKRVIAHCDVVVANYSAGVLEKLGLSYEVLRGVRADLIMLTSTGYGDSGPNRRYVTWGPNIEALSAMSSLSGFPHRECTVTQYAYPDALSALHGLFAALCALEHRTQTGQGQYIDVSQYEVMVAALGVPFMEALADGREPPRMGNRSRAAAPQGCYRCAGDDRWCVIQVRTDREWRALCQVIERADVAQDRRFATRAGRLENADEIDRMIEAWTSAHDAHDAMRVLQAVGIAAGAVQNVEDHLRSDAQLAAREFFEKIQHKKKGEVLATGIPIGLTGTPGRTSGSGSAVGEDNAYVFSTLLGMSEEEIRALVEIGAIEAPTSGAL